MHSPQIKTALSELNYASIAQSSALSMKTDNDRYTYIRSLIILGHYSKAKEKLEGIKGQLNNPALANFLTVQIQIFEYQNRRQCIEALVELQPLITQNAYLQGEYSFILGYVQAVLGMEKLAVRNYLHAQAAYIEAGYDACAAVTLFNLSCSYDHLNARDLLKPTIESLLKLYQKLQIPSVTVLSNHLQAYLKIDREEYAKAIPDLEDVLETSLLESRKRDAGAAAWLLLYSYLKAGKENAFHDFFETKRNLLNEFTIEYQNICYEIQKLSHRGLSDKEEAQSFLKKWKKLGIQGSPKFLLVDLLLERLAKNLEWQCVLEIASQTRSEMSARQVAISLVDLRYYEILASIKLGMKQEAKRLWHAYRHDAEELQIPVRIEKAHSLEKSYSLLPESSQHSNENRLVLNLGTNFLNWRDRSIDLSAKPKIAELFAILMRHSHPMKIEDVFFELYQCTFCPLSHEKRLNSLIDRARTMAQDSSVILRSNGRLQIHPHCQIQIIENETPDVLHIQRRHKKIQSLIRASKRPLSISDLHLHFDCSRRTLQTDLNELVKSLQIRFLGSGRKRAYAPRDVA